MADRLYAARLEPGGVAVYSAEVERMTRKIIVLKEGVRDRVFRNRRNYHKDLLGAYVPDHRVAYGTTRGQALAGLHKYYMDRLFTAQENFQAVTKAVSAG